MKMFILTITFFLFILGGLYTLVNYSAVAGSSKSTHKSWPSESKLVDKKSNHLVMFLHPGCACSKASVAELSRLMAQAKELTVQVVVMKSPKLEKLFADNSLIQQVKLIPQVTIFYDQDGREAKIFGAETSGHTLFFDQNSDLRFSGGLTMARGHEGESVGKDSILGLLSGKDHKTESSVFGCDIFGKIKTLTMVP